MGAYMCIAKNTVPPAQSKRVFVYVQCKKPIFWMPPLALSLPTIIRISILVPPEVTPTKRLVGAPYGQRATLKCSVRAFPRPIVYWNNTGG